MVWSGWKWSVAVVVLKHVHLICHRTRHCCTGSDSGRALAVGQGGRSGFRFWRCRKSGSLWSAWNGHFAHQGDDGVRCHLYDYLSWACDPVARKPRLVRHGKSPHFGGITTGCDPGGASSPLPRSLRKKLLPLPRTHLRAGVVELGRHTILRGWRSKGHAGSNPASGTKVLLLLETKN